MNRNRIIALLALLIIYIGVWGQSSSGGAVSVLNKVAEFNHLYPQEKVYLHFDNTGYFKGETIWFKAYVTQSSVGRQKNGKGTEGVYRPTSISKVLYVELITPGGDILRTQKLHINEEGQTNGQFVLDSVLVSGFYEIRAYTRYMTNWGVNALFSRVLPIFEAPPQYGDYSKPTISSTLYKDRNPNARMGDSTYLVAAKEGIYTNDDPEDIYAHFYPEGGDLVQGLKSRVAFTVIDDNGRSYKSKGAIVDAEGKTVCAVETDSTGRGLFDITPSGEKLFLSMSNPKKKVRKFELPAVKAEGLTLHLDVVSNNISAEIRSQTLTDENNNATIGYALMQGGNIYACDTMTNAPLIELELSRNDMPEGVNQITIFNDEGRILAERLFFICPKTDKTDSITVTTVSKAIAPVSEVELNLHTAPNTTFSFAALDYGSMTGWKEGNAKTWMLLSSDVKGYIANIDYYFEADDQEHRESADLLMMTQGWRRYDWNLMSGQTWFDDIQPIEDSLYVFGQLREYRKRNPVSNVKVEAYMYTHDGHSMSGTTHTDSLGNYAFKMPDINGDWELQLFTKRDDKRKTYYVGIDRQFAPTPRFITPDETRLIQKGDANLFADPTPQSQVNGVDDDGIKFAEKVHVIPQVTVKARKYWTSSDNIQWYNQNTGRKWATVFYNGPQELDKILDKGDPVPTVFEFLNNKNPLFGHQPENTLPVEVGIDTWDGGMSYGGRNITWIIDNGLAVYSSGRSSFGRTASGRDVIAFPQYMDEIKAIYIVPWSPKEEESAVRIYIYRRIIYTTESQKGLRRTHYQGYNIPETFQMEDVNILPPLENLRRTIYWEPNVKTDANGDAKITFYNNLSAKQLYISAEGITTDGKVITNN